MTEFSVDINQNMQDGSVEYDEAIDEAQSSLGTFTYIPPQPKAYYKLLMTKCIDYELNIRSPDDTSLKLLSKKVSDLLNECSLRWRISPVYRAVLYLDIVQTKHDNEHPLVTFEHISEGMHLLKEMMKKRDMSLWTLSEKKEVLDVYFHVHESMQEYLKQALEHLYKIKTTSLEPVFFILYSIYDLEIFRVANPDISPFYNDIRETIRKTAVTKYTEQRNKVFEEQKENEVLVLLTLSQWIQDEIGKLHTKFPEALMGQINVLQLVIEKQVPLFTLDMENLANEILQDVKASGEEGRLVDDIFDLYREVLAIKVLYEKHCQGASLNFSIEGWFRPHVRKWLEMTDAKTQTWVQSAISVDEFKPISSVEAHSSSIVDLFTSFNQTIDFLKNINWPNEVQYAKFMTTLSKTICKAIEQYCVAIDDLFVADIFPEEPGETMEKQSNWYVRAKESLASNQKITPFDFKPELCVKMNNIEAARENLNKLYNTMDVDYLANLIQDSGPPVPDKNDTPEKMSYLFTIKIVRAENLAALDANGLSDPYCILNDEKGRHLAQTRVIYETLNPRWDEAFDISVEIGDQMRWVSVTVWDSDQLGTDDICGRAYFKLDPVYFGDFVPHDVWLDLEQQGKLLLRISMEGEKDDIQFHFGKAFRVLKRTGDDMSRRILDRILPFLIQCISKNVLNNLVKKPSLKTFFKEEKKKELTDLEIEEAIGPLFDYFDANFPILSNSLNENVMLAVMGKIWKLIETIIEDLLIPPYSDRPSDMKPLGGAEVDVVFKWLKFLRDYFNAGGNGVPAEILDNARYQKLLAVQLFYDMDTEALMQEYLQNQIETSLVPRSRPSKLGKSVLNQRNLGTIRKRKTEKRKQRQDNGEIILRILRMRSGTKNFLKQQAEERARRAQASATKESASN